MSVPENQIIPPVDPPPALPTWDSASEPVVDPPAIVDPPLAPEIPAPAEPAPLEKPDPAPLVAESEAVRESESQPEPEKVVPDPNDPPEIQAITGEGGKRWARRQFQDAAPIRTFADLDKPIQEFGDELYKRSESRYFEHVDDIARHHLDYLTERMFGVKTFKEAKEKFTTPSQPAPAIKPPDNQSITVEELNLLSNEEAIEKFNRIQQAAVETARQEAETRLQAEKKAFQTQLDALEGKVTTREQQEIQTEIKTEKNKLYDKVWDAVIEGGIRTSGLEVKPDDPPKIASLKNAAAKLLRSDSEPTFDKDEENRKLVKRVVEFADRREFHNAWREEDNLTVRARAAFETVKNSAELQAVLSEIEAYTKSKANPRAVNPVIPAPGGSSGIKVNLPTTWDEAEKASPVLSA